MLSPAVFQPSSLRSDALARLIATLCLTFLSATATADEVSWPAFRGADGTGSAAGVLPPGDGPLALDLAWQTELGSGYSGVTVADGTLVTAAFGDEMDHVVALDPTSGEKLWRAELGPSYSGHDGSHDGPIATPAVADGRVFMLGPHGDLKAYDLDDGSVLWERHLVEDLGTEAPFYGFGGSPRVVDGKVVLQIGGEEGSVAAFDAATGALEWRTVEDEIFTESPVVTELGDRRQVVVIGGEKVVGLDPASGAELWTFEHQGGRGAMGAFTSSPLPVGDDRLFLKHANASSAVLAVTGGDEGEPAFVAQTKAMGRSYSPPSLWDGTVYGYTARFLSAADAATGELLWRSREPGDGFVVTFDDHLAVLTKKGTLHLAAASREGWSEIARLELFDEKHAWTPPSVAGSSLFVRSLGGVARVDLVRTDAPVELPTVEIPRQLEGLVADLEATREADEETAPVVDAFWRDAEPPLVGDAPDGDPSAAREVVFLWRGEAKDPAIAGDMIGMRREEPLHRLDGTDLWWWATELDPRARVSYVFVIDDEPVLDPSHVRQHPSTVLGPDMNWQRGDGLTMSWLAMPDWPGRRGLESFTTEVELPGHDGETTTRPLSARVWLPPGYAVDGDTEYPVLYVQDPAAIEAGGWTETLDDVVGRGVEPLLVVFLRPVRSPAWPSVLAEQFVPAIDRAYRTRAERESRASVGMGWSANAALRVVLEQPETFGVVGLQSLYGLESSLGAIREAAGDTTAAEMPLRIYQEWGRWDLVSPHEEMDMRRAGRQIWDLLRERDWRPMGGEVWDSTDWASWRHRTAVLLESLFPAAGDGPSPRLASWTTEED